MSAKKLAFVGAQNYMYCEMRKNLCCTDDDLSLGNPINMLEIRFNVTNSALFREKIFSIGNLGRGYVPLPPFPRH